MIKQVYSRRLKRSVYRLDARTQGKRIRKFFLKRADAEAVAYKFRYDAIVKPFGLPTTLERPLLSDLCAKLVADITNRREKTRTARVLAEFCSLLSTNIFVDEVTKADCKKYIDKRVRDGVKPQTID